MKYTTTITLVLECSTDKEFENHIQPLLNDIANGKVQRDMGRKDIKVKCTYKTIKDGKETENYQSDPTGMGA
jgi:hypothetical protein